MTQKGRHTDNLKQKNTKIIIQSRVRTFKFSFPFSDKGFDYHYLQFAFASLRKTVHFAGQVPLTSVLKLGGFFCRNALYDCFWDES